MTKQSAMVTAGAMVLGLMAGVAAHDLTQRAPSQPTQIVLQIQPGGSTTTTTPLPTAVPPQTGDRG